MWYFVNMFACHRLIVRDRHFKSNHLNETYFHLNNLSVYNWVEVKTKMWAMNLGRPVSVPPLNEAAAIELGANLLGEAIIFLIGAGALIFEYAR